MPPFDQILRYGRPPERHLPERMINSIVKPFVSPEEQQGYDEGTWTNAKVSNIGADIPDDFVPDNAAPLAVAGTSGNAENAGKAISLAKETGAPAHVIDADLENFVQQNKSQKAGAAVQANPKIAGYVQSTPLAAKVSNDDYDNLHMTSESLTDFEKLQRIPYSTRIGMWANEEFKKGDIANFILGGVSSFIAGIPEAVYTSVTGLQPTPGGEAVDPEDRARTIAMTFGLLRSAATGGKGGIPVTDKPTGPRAKMEDIAGYYGEKTTADIRAMSEQDLKDYVTSKTSEAPIRPGENPTVDEFHADQQKLDAQHLDKVIDDAAPSKTKERSPDAFSEFAKQHDVGDIEISGDALAKIYESEGKTPGPGDGLFGYVPNIAEQLRTSLASGVDVKVPVADYVAHTDAALHEKVKDSIRFRDEGVTKEEAATTKEEAQEVAEIPEGEKIVGQEGDNFTTSSGRTVDREEALKITKASGQYAADRAEWAMTKAGYDPKVLHDQNLSYEARELITKTADAEDSLYLNPLFRSGKDLNIAEGEFKRYSDKIENRQNELLTRSIEAARRGVAKTQTAEWRKSEAELTNQVSTDYRSRPDILADRYLRSGDLPTGERVTPVKLDKATVDDILGSNHSISEFTAEKGMNPDDVASTLGFPSGSEMLKTVDEYNRGRKQQGLGPKAYFDAAVAKEVDAQMRAKFGLLPENILAEAREIALGDYHADILSDEVRILAKQAGGEPPLSKDDLKQWVKDNFSGQRVGQVREWEPLRRAVERGGRDAEKALLGGDFEKAFKAKQRQLLAFLGMREAEQFKRDRKRAERSIDRITDSDALKSLDPDTVYQARRMLQNLGVGDTGFIKEGLAEFGQFVADSEGQIAVADFLADPSFRKSIGDMTVQEYRDFAKSMQSLVHVARDRKKMDSTRGSADLDNVVFDIRKELDRFNLIEKPLNPSVKQRAGSKVRAYIVAPHLLIERMLDYTDQFNPNGPITTYLDRPLRQSYNKEIQLTEQVVKDLRKMKEFIDSSVSDRIPNSLIPNPLASNGLMDMTRQNLRQLMLYTGARSGVEKVVKGFNIDEKDLRRFIYDNASAKDMKWVKGMWDLFARLKPEADAMQLRDTGVPVDSVEFSGLTTKHGKLDGGYFPISYDRARSNIEGDLRAQNPTFDQHYVPATTPNSYTKRRTGYSAAIDLEGLFTGSKIRGMVHDIAFRESVRNASKLLNNADFMLEMRKKWGTEIADLLPDWLKDIANVHNVDDEYARGLIRGMAFVRQNVVSALIALNPGTYLKHGGTAMSMSAAQVGVKELISAGKDIAGKNLPTSPEFMDALKQVTAQGERGESVRDFIYNSSPVMRTRLRTRSESIQGAYEEASRVGAKQKFMELRESAIYLGRYPVSMSDAFSALPTWYAAYLKEFNKDGDHAQAAFVADKEVSRAHGSSFIGDKPAILRQPNTLGGETLRWFGSLFNFWNHMTNNYFQAAWDTQALKDGRYEPNANGKSLSARAFMLFMIPLVIEELASPALDEHKDSLGIRMMKALVRHLGSSIFGLREFTNAIAGGYEPSVGMMGILMKNLANVGRDINRGVTGRTLRKDWMTDAATFLGFTTGIGGPQMGKTGGFLTDVATGRDRPRTFNEIRQGLRTGHSRARNF